MDDEQLPDFMLTDEMQQAMTTLRQLTEKERVYHQYQVWRLLLQKTYTSQLPRLVA